MQQRPGIFKAVFLMTATIAIISCGKKEKNADQAFIKSITENVDDNALASTKGNDWLTHGLNYSENRFSPLDEIKASNINQLGLAWSIDLDSKRGLEATPIVVDGVMFITGVWSTVYAIDVRKGNIIWKYDPEVPRKQGEKLCCDIVNRGVALYKGKVFVGTLDGRLIALNAATGKMIWSVNTVDTTKPYSITGAPRVVNGKVLIGNGGAEFGVRGYLTAYDHETGKQVWRFYTVPGDPSKPFENKAMEAAAKTWSGDWWKYGGGGTVWDAMAYDPELKLLYVGTGNGSPWDRKYRSNGTGDNLYLSSILALNPDNGELVWHYQTTPGDSWDFTATQQMTLADLTIRGVKRKVLMQAPKNGFFYILDRTNGKLITADPFVYTNWAKSVDSITGKPIEADGIHYETVNTDISPTYNGGHNWHSMAFNPKLNLMFIPARENVTNYGHDPKWKYNQKGFGTGNGWNLAIGNNPKSPTRKDTATGKFPRGMLIAWDPIQRKEIWRVPQKVDWNGGVLATASDLVFQGTAEGKFYAYNAATGAVVWEANVGGGVIAAPVSYLVDGKQYISIVVGWGGGYGMKKKFAPIQPGRIFTFAIDAKAAYPAYNKAIPQTIPDIAFKATKEETAQGETLFWQYCGTCHVVADGGGGLAPDLAYSNATTHQNIMAIVRDGAYLPLGMPKFGDRLQEKDVQLIQKYILSKAKEAKQAAAKK